MLVLFLAMGGCGVGSIPCFAQQPAKAFRVPFHTVKGMILLDATVNGKPASLLLDTGADFTLISPQASGLPTVKLRTLTATQTAGANGEYVKSRVDLRPARPAAISLLRAINPGVRLTESQIATELKTIPDPTTPADIHERQFARLDRNIDQASKTLVKIPGVDLPSEIRDRLASQAGAEDAVRARVAAQQAAATGQYKNAMGNRMRVGQDAYDSTTKRYIGTVSKVYAGGSYDVKPD